MGFWDNILRSPTGVSLFTPRVQYVGGPIATDELVSYFDGVQQADVAHIWRTQPNLRTVVSFLARNVAQLGLHTFERVNETDRQRDRASVVARALAAPDSMMTSYDLVYALVGDLMLYDRAYWFVGGDDSPSGVMLRRLPPTWVSPVMKDPFTVGAYRVSFGSGNPVDVPPENILPFTGYSPTSPSQGSPTVESLRDTLAEQIEAARYRAQVWKRGGRVSAVLQRPKDAPNWSDAAREAFRDDWYSKYTGRGSKAGGTPILEDGMTLNRIDFNAQEQQFVEAAKLSLNTVAAAFHVNPTMIGQNDGATYSNVREFRRMLYGDTLGPLLAQIEARVNAFLLPMLGVDPERFYVEFNINEKLQGSFEEQASAMQSAVGAPYMLRSEARARMNLPAIDGADELVVPMNVLTGGQASPNDTGSQNRASGRRPRVKARASSTDVQKGEKLLADFFARQARSVRSALGTKDDSDWWDEDRWDEELSEDLFTFAQLVSKSVAHKTLQSIGFSPDEYDTDRTLAWLQEVSKRSAKSINATTFEQIQSAIDDEDQDALETVFSNQASRAGISAQTMVTTLSGFATQEAARQTAGDEATKTWVAGPNPRPDHAAMDGETVALSEDFSNGLAWPGDASGGADDIAGCNCALEINY